MQCCGIHDIIFILFPSHKNGKKYWVLLFYENVYLFTVLNYSIQYIKDVVWES